jgi:hypothetical protein
MSAAIEFQGPLQCNNARHISRGYSLVELFQSDIQVCHVCVVMLGMMNGHSFGGNSGY